MNTDSTDPTLNVRYSDSFTKPSLAEMTAQDFEALKKDVAYQFTFRDPDGEIAIVGLNVVTLSHRERPWAQLNLGSWSFSDEPQIYAIHARRGHLGEELVKAARKIESPGFLKRCTQFASYGPTNSDSDRPLHQ